MKIVSEELSNDSMVLGDRTVSYIQYRTEINLGDGEYWYDIGRRTFDLESKDFHDALKNPEKVLRALRDGTRRNFLLYVEKKLFEGVPG